MSSLGLYPTGALPKGALTRSVVVATYTVLGSSGAGAFAPIPSVKANAAAVSAGVGQVSGGLNSIASASASMTGLASFAPVLTAEVSAQTDMSGASVFGPTNAPGSYATFEGNSNFSAVSYAVFLGAERACIHQEQRTLAIPGEDRILRILYEDRTEQVDVLALLPEDRLAIVSFEDRVLRIPPELRGAVSNPRKRIC